MFLCSYLRDGGDEAHGSTAHETRQLRRQTKRKKQGAKERRPTAKQPAKQLTNREMEEERKERTERKERKEKGRDGRKEDAWSEISR